MQTQWGSHSRIRDTLNKWGNQGAGVSKITGFRDLFRVSLGHAHGLGEAVFFDSVMNPYVFDICELRDHDVADYEELWGAQ